MDRPHAPFEGKVDILEVLLSTSVPQRIAAHFEAVLDLLTCPRGAKEDTRDHPRVALCSAHGVRRMLLAIILEWPV